MLLHFKTKQKSFLGRNTRSETRVLVLGRSNVLQMDDNLGLVRSETGVVSLGELLLDVTVEEGVWRVSF